jgi:hypothetical protein
LIHGFILESYNEAIYASNASSPRIPFYSMPIGYASTLFRPVPLMGYFPIPTPFQSMGFTSSSRTP